MSLTCRLNGCIFVLSNSSKEKVVAIMWRFFWYN
nr:MAG TPA: hypothetical protein [Caudoviricetes sp.]